MKTSLHRSHGFSLIELMVGLVIGMLAVIIMMQIFSNADNNKRITNGGNDAQINGTIALYELERDLRQAGNGLTSFAILGCGVTYTTTSDSTNVVLPALAPVTVNPSTTLVPAGDANTDTLLVVSGTSSSPPEGDATVATTTATAYQITTPTAFSTGDYVLATTSSQPTPCNLSLVKVTSISSATLGVTAGTAGLATGSTVFDLGSTLIIRAYAVRGGNLTVCDYAANNCGNASNASNSAIWVPVANNIVSMRAQYVRDTSGITGSSSTMDGVVDTFDQITPGSTADTTSIPTYCKWARVLGVRVALVARSEQFSDAKNTVTSAMPTWAGSTANAATSATVDTTNPTAVPITLSGSWQNYRYNTLQTTVPLRNIVWQATYQGGSGGC